MSEWISVKDGLPPKESEGTVYILAVKNQKGEVSIITARWSIYGWNDFVTHWMPLPEPPSGERGKG